MEDELTYSRKPCPIPGGAADHVHFMPIPRQPPRGGVDPQPSRAGCFWTFESQSFSLFGTCFISLDDVIFIVFT